MPKAVKSFIVFGALATVPVITDTITVFAFKASALSITKAIASIAINFIFTDCFFFAALVIALIYGDYWIFAIKKLETIASEQVSADEEANVHNEITAVQEPIDFEANFIENRTAINNRIAVGNQVIIVIDD